MSKDFLCIFSDVLKILDIPQKLGTNALFLTFSKSNVTTSCNSRAIHSPHARGLSCSAVFLCWINVRFGKPVLDRRPCCIPKPLADYCECLHLLGGQQSLSEEAHTRLRDHAAAVLILCLKICPLGADERTQLLGRLLPDAGWAVPDTHPQGKLPGELPAVSKPGDNGSGAAAAAEREPRLAGPTPLQQLEVAVALLGGPVGAGSEAGGAGGVREGAEPRLAELEGFVRTAVGTLGGLFKREMLSAEGETLHAALLHHLDTLVGACVAQDWWGMDVSSENIASFDAV